MNWFDSKFHTTVSILANYKLPCSSLCKEEGAALTICRHVDMILCPDSHHGHHVYTLH